MRRAVRRSGGRAVGSREAAEHSGVAVILRGVHAPKDLRLALRLSGVTGWVDRRGSGSGHGRPEILRALKRPQDDRRGESVRRPEAGFSLIELLVVLALLGLMAAVVAPSLASLDAPVATTPADEVVRLFADARRLAVQEARPVVLRVEFQSGGYWLLATGDPGARGRLRAGGLLRVASGGDVGSWRFTPDGRVMGPTLFVTGEKPRAVRFDPGTGELLP